MRLALLTSDHQRHKYFAHKLSLNHELLLVVAEEKGNQSQHLGDCLIDTELLKDHFAELRSTEDEFFGNVHWPDTKLVRVQRGQINSCLIIEELQKTKPDGIAVFGSGILRDEILSTCPDRVINAHQGISPYYRGSGTNFWPFVHGQLGYVGVTMHYIDKGIDTGQLICHGFPSIEPTDSMHEIGCKVVRKSADLMSEIFNCLESNYLSGIAQWSKGVLYQRKDFNAEAVRTARKNMADGLVEKYLNSQTHRMFQAIELRK